MNFIWRVSRAPRGLCLHFCLFYLFISPSNPPLLCFNLCIAHSKYRHTLLLLYWLCVMQTETPIWLYLTNILPVISTRTFVPFCMSADRLWKSQNISHSFWCPHYAFLMELWAHTRRKHGRALLVAWAEQHSAPHYYHDKGTFPEYLAF